MTFARRQRAVLTRLLALALVGGVVATVTAQPAAAGFRGGAGMNDMDMRHATNAIELHDLPAPDDAVTAGSSGTAGLNNFED